MEYYWSNFIKLADDDARKNTPLVLNGTDKYRIPDWFKFLATINNDQTTESLSPRLLDRAWVITLDFVFLQRLLPMLNGYISEEFKNVLKTELKKYPLSEKKWLFYQPEIVYSGKPSDINLRRNTKISLGGNAKNEKSYTPSYTPDYIIKSVDGSGNETYEIADAKFSDFDTVKEYYLPAAAFKYILSVRGIDNAVIEGMQLYYFKGNPKNDRHPTLEKPYTKIKYLY